MPKTYMPFLLPLSSGSAEGVLESMGNKVPLKTGMLIDLPVTSRPLISLQKEAVSSPCNFTTTHLTACILNFYLPCTSRSMKRRTLSQRPISATLTPIALHCATKKRKAQKFWENIRACFVRRFVNSRKLIRAKLR